MSRGKWTMADYRARQAREQLDHQQYLNFEAKLPPFAMFRTSNGDTHDLDTHIESHNWWEFLCNMDARREEEKRAGEMGPNHTTTRPFDFHYIRYPEAAFKGKVFKHLEKARTFVDVGCGGGDKLALVKGFRPSMQVFGIEWNPGTAAWASLYADHVFCCDALTFNYVWFDVIYAYYPISRVDLMIQLCDRIMSTMHAKAKFILAGFHYKTDDPRFIDEPNW